MYNNKLSVTSHHCNSLAQNLLFLHFYRSAPVCLFKASNESLWSGLLCSLTQLQGECQQTSLSLSLISLSLSLSLSPVIREKVLLSCWTLLWICKLLLCCLGERESQDWKQTLVLCVYVCMHHTPLHTFPSQNHTLFHCIFHFFRFGSSTSLPWKQLSLLFFVSPSFLLQLVASLWELPKSFSFPAARVFSETESGDCCWGVLAGLVLLCVLQV